MIKGILKSCVVASVVFAGLSAPLHAETIAIIGGTVHTSGVAGTLENATVLVRDGVIVSVGTDVKVPKGATRIDATGQVVTPGLMHGASYLGLTEISAVKPTNAHSAKGSIFGAAFDVSHGLNFRSIVVPDVRRRGVTHALTIPSGADGLFSGSGALINLTGSHDMVLAKGPMFADLDKGGNRTVAWAKLRLIFDDVKEYKRNRTSIRKGKGRSDFVLSSLNMDALIPVVGGKQALVLFLNEEVDIHKAIKLKADYGLKLVLVGAAEAWLVADALAAPKIPVVIDAQDNMAKSFDSIGSSRRNAAVLAKAGVTFAIADAGGTHNASNIRQHAAIAVAHGLDWATALQAITSAPAEIFGLGKYGKLEPGMAANIVVWDGDPLQVTSNTTHVLVNGKDMPLISRRTMLRDKYLNK